MTQDDAKRTRNDSPEGGGGSVRIDVVDEAYSVFARWFGYPSLPAPEAIRKNPEAVLFRGR